MGGSQVIKGTLSEALWDPGLSSPCFLTLTI